ncbi:RICIN domain-containing protein [Streptomyces albidoflavus]
MSLWTSLEPASASVEPGGSAQVRLRVRNTGDVVDEYRFEPVGALAPWTRVEPQTLRLYPGTTGTVELTFSPPRTPDAVAGPNPYAVRITPTEHPEAVTVPEGNITVSPFTEVRAELVPVTVKGRFRGRPRLAVDNLGNTKVTASVSGSDNGDHLSYEIRPQNVQIEPGRAAFVDTVVRPRQKIWFGSKEERPFTLTLRRSGAEPGDVEGTYVQRGFLPRWLATFLGIFMALAIAFVMIWIAYKPQVRTSATEQAAAAEALAPSPTPEPPSQAPPPEPEPEPSEEPAGGADGGGGGEPSPTEEPGVVPAERVLLRNTTTGYCADIPDRGKGKINERVQQATCHETGDNQLWDLVVTQEKGGPNGAPLFLIRNTMDRLCMDLPKFGPQPIRSPISEYTCDGTMNDNQLWWAQELDNGAYWIRNAVSDNLCLEVAGSGDGKIGARLLIFTCTLTDDQEWEIMPTQQKTGS